jgi:alpha,alpha-trehalose phosphorylase
MISHPCFSVEPWALRETELDLNILAQAESLFALSNGHIGLRGNLDEGEPHGLPGSYLNGFYEVRPLPYPETAYGYPEVGQELVNVSNGKIIRLLVDDEPFDIRYGELRRHERLLDFRAGVLRRRLEWVSPAHMAVRISTVRMVSFVHRAVAAILYEVEPLDRAAELVVQSELVTDEPLPDPADDDPRSGRAQITLSPEHHAQADGRVVLVHRTLESDLVVSAGMEHALDVPAGAETHTESDEDVGRFTVTARVEPGQRLRLVKFLAYGWSGQRSVPALRDQVESALLAARDTGWEALVQAQREYLDSFWERADVELEGDDELQQAIRFSLFHTLQAGARAEQRAIPAKGLTGTGYGGHAFWDMEAFVLPLLTYTLPDASADALRWRHSTLDYARSRAQTLGLKGAAFPWRTIDGRESSGYWPASTAAFHIGADVADAVVRYGIVTADGDFEREVGLELLVETARLWCSVGHFDSRGSFRIDGVTGPDEYSALADNNVYTNLMAQRNLRAAAEAVEREPERSRELGVEPDEVESWRKAADAVLVPYDESLGVHPQAEGFSEHELWDFDSTSEDEYPLMLHFSYFDLYRKQVLKQADLVLALYRRGDAFSEEEKRRDFEYYERLTVRDSSLSACVQAIIAAEVGHVELAYAYLGEAALVDLDDINHNTRDGLHIASLAGAWLALVAGLGGLRESEDGLAFAPRLPKALSRLAFRLSFRGRRLSVEVDRSEARYTLIDGEPLRLRHHGEELTLRPGEPQTRDLPPLPKLEEPSQPAHRAPLRRNE